jgi:GntR family transcriptional regulator
LEIVKEPIYKQLNNILRELVDSDTYQISDKFLTERVICKQFGVSRSTANKAISNLVSEGLLEFKKGIGTFVKNKSSLFDLRSLISFTKMAYDLGKTPSAQILEFKKIAGKDIEQTYLESLKIDGTDEVYFLKRLRLLDGVPSLLDHRYIVARFCRNLTQADVEKSLITLWADKYHLNISGVDQIIRAVSLTDNETRLLGLEASAACLSLKAVGFVDEEVPLWLENTLLSGDQYFFRNRLGAVRSTRPAERVSMLHNPNVAQR